jgi:hypothetical protein
MAKGFRGVGIYPVRAAGPETVVSDMAADSLKKGETLQALQV